VETPVSLEAKRTASHSIQDTLKPIRSHLDRYKETVVHQLVTFQADPSCPCRQGFLDAKNMYKMQRACKKVCVPLQPE